MKKPPAPKRLTIKELQRIGEIPKTLGRPSRQWAFIQERTRLMDRAKDKAEARLAEQAQISPAPPTPARSRAEAKMQKRNATK